MDRTTNQQDESQKKSVPELTPSFRSKNFMGSNCQASLLFTGATSMNENVGMNKSSISTDKLVPLVPSNATEKSSGGLNQKRPAAAITPFVISSASIPELPSMHILERTCVTLHPRGEGKGYKLGADVVVARILDFLRVHSIALTSEPESGRMDCRAASRLSFVIQLWRKKSNGNDVLLMEVQRRRGCCIEMNAVRRNLIQQVTENSARPGEQGIRPSDNYDKFLSTTCKRHRRDPPSISSNLNYEHALRITLGLIESRRSDREELGWKSLASLTNPLYFCKEDVQKVARVIVHGGGSLGARLQFELERVFWNSIGATVDKNVLVHHHLALQTLANALEQAFPSSGSSNNNGDDHSSGFMQAVLDALLRDLEQATESPQKAAWSAKCLRLLLAQKETLDMANLQSLAIKAFEHGKAHHLSLEQESSKLLQAITTSN